MKYIDLTLQVSKMNKFYKWAEVQPNKGVVMGHVGTHIDIYETKQIPLEYMQTRGVLFDVSHITDREITSDDVDLDYIRPGDFVMLRTGCMERHPYGSGKYLKDSTLLSWELIEALCEEKIAFIGMDAPDIRRGKEHIEAEKRLEKKGIYVVENMTNLKEVNRFEACKMLTMWLENEEATGIKCRVVAIQP